MLQAARKRLVKLLADIPRGAVQLLPYFARITATLAPVFPDVSEVPPPPPFAALPVSSLQSVPPAA